jgi:hypothetical protein
MSKPRPRTESELVELVRSIEAPAPDALHREVRALISARRGSRASTAGRPTIFRGLLATAALAAMVVAVVLVIALGGGNGGASTMSMREASAPTLRPATAAAPSERAGNRAQLTAAVDGVSFPYWEERFGWRSTGARSDSVGGHAMTTVFYVDGHGHRIGYAIIAGAPPRISGGTAAWRGGTRYRLFFANGAPVVTWRREGHMCVLSGRGVSSATLIRLADWGEPA